MSEQHARRSWGLGSRTGKDFLTLSVDLLAVWDICAGLLSGKLALLLSFGPASVTGHDFVPSGPFWREIILGSLLACLVLREPRLATDRKVLASGRFVAIMRVRGVAALALLLSVGLSTRPNDAAARTWLMTWSALFGACVIISRVGFLLHARGLCGSGGLRETIAVVTMAGASGGVAARLAADADVLLHIGATAPAQSAHVCAGIMDAFPPGPPDLQTLLHLGRSGAIDSVVVAVAQGRNADAASVVDQLKSLPVQIVICPDASWEAHGSDEVRLLGGMPMAVVAKPPISACNLVVKLLIDKILAAIFLVLAAPLMIVIAAAIILDSPGPVIFRQRRSGWAGASFMLFKFRTMRADVRGRPRQTMRGDPRCTRVGTVLRRTSLDELPQFLNVLLGDMSLVGPRPHAEGLHTAELAGQAVVAEYAQRYRVRPGMTGWAQVNGFRGSATSTEQLRRRVEHDLYYIENWSLLLDLKILLLTPFAVLSGENAF